MVFYAIQTGIWRCSVKMYAIDVRNVSKIYRLYQKPSDRLKEVLNRKPVHQAFQSLRDVSFSVPMGESLGIIGDNGAGKSTMLKIVAGTLTPTSGTLKINGRVAALLELGAGFHPEFTGRQNIWMNASLMGLDKGEIASLEKSIIEFSELGSFIDRPIKIYSSGMVVRLAFSIATSVDPDILIIDEALSVGDQHFQKKCIDRMVDFKRKNKTILFCSHGMFLVNQLCDRVVWFDNGKIKAVGSATHVTAKYENYTREKSNYNESPTDVENVPGNGEIIENTPAIIKNISLNGSLDNIYLEQGSDLVVDIAYESFQNMEFFMAAGIRRNDDLVCHVSNMSNRIKEPLNGQGPGHIRLSYRNLPFFHGEFSVVAFIMDTSGLQCFHKKASPVFSVLPKDAWENEMGLLRLEHEWYRT